LWPLWGRSIITGEFLRACVVALVEVVRTIRAYKPDLSVRSRAVIEAALLTGGSIGTARQVAPYLGLRNRFELARLLKREGLPPLHDLAGWASVLTWLDRAECTGCSLCDQAFRARKDPATCYRVVKRLTGLRWLEVRRRGSTWVVERFLRECGSHFALGDRASMSRSSVRPAARDAANGPLRAAKTP